MEVNQELPNLAAALVGEYTGPPEELIVERAPHPSGGQLDVVPTSVAMFLVVRQLYHGRAPEFRLARLLARSGTLTAAGGSSRSA